ncbi:MAG: PIN-like domain-containing protein [Vulcanimicrobiaceae bacterium]
MAGPTMGDARLLLSSGTLVCPDTSALLEVLSMPGDDAELFLDAIESLKKRVVIPPTVAAEFRDLGLKKVEEAVNKATVSVKHTGKFLEKPPKGAGAEYFDEFMSAVVASADNFRKRVRAEIERRHQRLLALIDECTGPELPHADKLQILADAGNRYLTRRPPGYTDVGKFPRGDQAAYGDIFVFFEMIHVARARAADVAFVTNDSKEDWWELDPSVNPRRLLRGRRELSQEFRAESGRAFAVFHGLRFVSDLTSLDVLLRSMSGALDEWEKRAALWTRSNMEQFYRKIGAEMQSLHRIPTGLDLTAFDMGMARYQDILQDMRLGIPRFGFDPGAFSISRLIVPPSMTEIVKKSLLAVPKFAVPDFVQSHELDRLARGVAGAQTGVWDMMKSALQIPDSYRVLRDMTVNIAPSFQQAYMDQVRELVEQARNAPAVHPTVMRLDELSRPKMPERRRDASALRRIYSRRRRTLRRSLRGKRINLLNENLPLKRVLVPRKYSERT